MSGKLKTIWNVTKWEFNRFFKWRDLVYGLLFFLFFGLAGGGVGWWIASDTLIIPDVAVADYGVFSPDEFESEEIRFLDRSDVPIDTLVKNLAKKEFDAFLTIDSPDTATIRMHNERGWLLQLRQFLIELRTGYMLKEFNIDETVYNSIEDGVVLNTHFEQASESSRADKWVAGIAIFLVLIAVFIGFVHQFTAITAEKQQRITEQVISAIEPQTWIDGKILGISGIGLVYVVFYGGMGLMSALLLVQFAGAPFGAGLALINPLYVMVFLILSLLGILMWNSFLAAIAATIDDPNSSQKSGLMMMPMLPVGFAFFTLMNPDSVALTFLGIFPLTSYAVLPARMVMSQVAWWEPVLALILLAATVWFFRIAAGKIFAAGMMMYGKEPTVKEMLYWLKRSV